MKDYWFSNSGLPMLAAAALLLTGCGRSQVAPEGATRAALTVTVVSPTLADWPERATATGSVRAWQESIIGSEVGGLKLAEVLAEVGDNVKKGQVLARFDEETVRIDLMFAEAAVAEAEANLDFARDQAERVLRLEGTGTVSQEEQLQIAAAEKTSAARLASTRAQLEAQRLRLRRTEILAPDDGVLSSRTATVGAVPAAGSELYRMILKHRLEWRATLPADQLARVAPGQLVTVRAAGQPPVVGRVRAISPVVDTGTLTGLIYVDLPDPGTLKAGMFASGEIEFGSAPSLHVPETSLVYRDGYQYVMKVDENRRVLEVKVTTDRRNGEHVEIIAGVSTDDTLVKSGGSFLNPGDTVLIVDEPPASSAASASAQTSIGGRS